MIEVGRIKGRKIYGVKIKGVKIMMDCPETKKEKNPNKKRLKALLPLLLAVGMLVAFLPPAFGVGGDDPPPPSPVASVTTSVGVTTNYTTFSAAISAIFFGTPGSTLMLLSDVTLDTDPYITKTVTLDLNGKTLSCDNHFITIASGTTTITDSGSGGKILKTTGVVVGYTIAVSDSSASLTIAGGTIDNRVTGFWDAFAIMNFDGSSLTISGGTVRSAEAAAIYNTRSTFVMTDGTVARGTSANPAAEAISNRAGTVSISGGSVYGTVTNDGTWDSATLNISGGTITSGTKAILSTGNNRVYLSGAPVISWGGGFAIEAQNKDSIYGNDGTATPAYYTGTTLPVQRAWGAPAAGDGVVTGTQTGQFTALNCGTNLTSAETATAVSGVYDLKLVYVDRTITYDTEGGTIASPTTDVTFNSTDPLLVPTRTGFTFEGWYDGDNGTGNQVTTSAGIPTGTVGGYITGGLWSLTESKTVYAKWTANPVYTITYDTEGGTIASPTTNVTFNSTDPLLVPTRAGYSFAGWYDGDDGTGNPITTATGVPTGTVGGYITGGLWSLTEGKTVYAKWTAIPVDSGSDWSAPDRTITVTELSSPLFGLNASTREVRAEANMNDAFSNSVEVKITDTQEDAAIFSFGSEAEVYPFDISLYIKGTNIKTQPNDGYAVTISLPVPESLLDQKEQLSIVHKDDHGAVTTLASRLTQINGAWYLVFEATEFSPYALVAGHTRLGGEDRIGTAVALANAGWVRADSVIIAPAENDHLVDALAAGPLAGKVRPILLTEKNRLNEATATQLKKLGTAKAYVIGAIDERVVSQLIELGIEPTVIKGKNRVETAEKIAAQLSEPAGSFVVGYNALADALSIAPYAAAHNCAILIANPDGTLPAEMKAYLGDRVNIIGGPDLVKDIEGAERFYGTDRYETNKQVLENFTYQYDKVYVANGTNAHLVDALAASSLAAKTKAPIILTGLNGSPALDAVRVRLKTDSMVIPLGGPAVVPNALIEHIRDR